MMKNLIPKEFIEKVKSNIERELNVNDARLLNHGPLSVLTNLLVNLQYDAKTYADFMFREYNVATATQLTSMMFHAGVYGYIPKFASPATAQLVLVIPVPELPVDKIITYSIPAYTEININSVPFRITGKITIECTSKSISAKYEHQSESKKLITSLITIENRNYYSVVIDERYVVQLQRYVDKFIVPQYNIGDNVSYEIFLPALPYKYKFFVNCKNNDPFDLNLVLNNDIENIDKIYRQLKELEIRQFKSSANPFTKCVFVNTLDEYSHLKVTLGNGIYGYKLNMNDEIIFVSDVTQGDAGNVQPCEVTLNDVEQIITDAVTGNIISVTTLNIKGVVPNPASGGKRPDSVEEIRKNILQLLTSRKSLSTILDFQKEFMNDDLQYATVLSTKIDLFNPVVQVYNVYKSLYEKKIIPQKTINYSDSKWNEVPNLIEFPETENLISPFIYIKRNSMIYSYKLKFKEKIILNPVHIIERHDIVPDLYIFFDYNKKKYYIKCDNLTDDVEAIFKLDSKEITLSNENGFEVELNNPEYVDNRYPLKAIIISEFKIVSATDKHLMHEYDVNSSGIEIVVETQKHKIYNTNKIFNMPFLEKKFFENKMIVDRNEYDNFYYFFDKIKKIYEDKRLIFDVDVNFCLPNTVDIDNIILDYAKINEYRSAGIKLKSPKLPVNIKILFDNNKLYEKGIPYNEFSNEIKLSIYSYLLSKEGTKIEFYRTDLIKYIKNIYPEIILDAVVIEPRSLVIPDFKYILNVWTEEKQVTVNDVLDTHPSYFFFDIENSKITFQSISL